MAFLWDAWGKQDLFVVTPGQKPVALTDFPVDPDILTSDIASFSWVSPTRDSVFQERRAVDRFAGVGEAGARYRAASRTPRTSRSRATRS